MRQEAKQGADGGDQPRVYTPDETARILRMNKNSCYQAIKRGEIPSLKFGRKLLVPVVALERMLAGL